MFVALALAVGPAAYAAPTPASAEAQARLERMGPHLTRYVKIATGEPALELAVYGPDEAVATVRSPDGVFAIAVDATTLRLRTGDACAAIDAAALLAAVDAAGLGADAPIRPRLAYRLRPGGQLDLSASFVHADDRALLSWIADLDAAEVRGVGPLWSAADGDVRWEIARKTGQLVSYRLGSDGVRRDGPDEAPPPGGAAAICPASTDPGLARQLAGQVRVTAYPDALAGLLAAWPTWTPDQRAARVEAQRQWWTGFFADDVPVWIGALDALPWREPLLADMADVDRFQSFAASADGVDPVLAWQQAWFASVGREMVEAHAAELEAAMIAGLPDADPDARAALLSEPLRSALTAAAEPALQATLGAAVDAGGQRLREAMSR